MAESGLENLVRVAFGDRPEAPVRVGPADPPGARWLTAVALGARGRYAAAAALLDALLRAPEVPRAVRAHAAVTRAAHLRQMGGHAAARRWDALGLALATEPAAVPAPSGTQAVVPGDPGLDVAAARVDALLGLAADALGLGEVAVAARLVRAAEPVAAAHPSWRPAVRWRWVAAELALCRDCPDRAAALAAGAVALSDSAGATRHHLKSELLLAVAEAGLGRHPATLIERLTALTERTKRSGLCTLIWPMQLQLQNLFHQMDPDSVNTQRDQAVRILRKIFDYADPLGRSVLVSSPWVPELLAPGMPHSAGPHPPEARRSAHSSRMECKNPP